MAIDEDQKEQEDREESKVGGILKRKGSFWAIHRNEWEREFEERYIYRIRKVSSWPMPMNNMLFSDCFTFLLLLLLLLLGILSYRL